MESISFGTAQKTASLCYPVSGAGRMTSNEGESFIVDRIELVYTWWDEWLISEVEIGGAVSTFKPYRYKCMTTFDITTLPEWARRFVSTVDPAKELAQ